ncbi:MAG: helix-turn-helix transcriptional regulator [Succinivibrio sp.]|nr:helix-turn-helix transcriptional regulator [Succinivibrio sp.]
MENLDFTCPGELGNTGFAYTMSLISGKYKMHILYCLATHKVIRFNEMKRVIGGRLTFRTLSSTLKDLERDGLISRHEYPQIPPKVEYALTQKGESLMPVMKALCQWGSQHMPGRGDCSSKTNEIL